MLPRVNFIKIDVEGMELQVIKGAKQLLENSHFPTVLLEAWDAHWFKDQREELISFLEGLGYQLFFLNNCDVIAQYTRISRYLNFLVDPETTHLSYYFSDNSSHIN